VPAGTSRLRLALMASHTKSELREAARLLAACIPASAREAGLRVADAATKPQRSRVFDGLRDAA
jgi:glycine C-acetyltransferase/8-amino-7-oxononanoate synthase